MGRVIFRCPNTLAEFDSGFQAGTTEMKAVPQTTTIRLRCPICGDSHELKLADARIEEKSSARPR
jgi:hypothetical protein